MKVTYRAKSNGACQIHSSIRSGRKRTRSAVRAIRANLADAHAFNAPQARPAAKGPAAKTGIKGVLDAAAYTEPSPVVIAAVV